MEAWWKLKCRKGRLINWNQHSSRKKEQHTRWILEKILISENKQVFVRYWSAKSDSFRAEKAQTRITYQSEVWWLVLLLLCTDIHERRKKQFYAYRWARSFCIVYCLLKWTQSVILTGPFKVSTEWSLCSIEKVRNVFMHWLREIIRKSKCFSTSYLLAVWLEQSHVTWIWIRCASKIQFCINRIFIISKDPSFCWR